jgi:hypothetical protein
VVFLTEQVKERLPLKNNSSILWLIGLGIFLYSSNNLGFSMMQKPLTLTTTISPSGKPVFQLNDKEFIPVIYMCSWQTATPEKVKQLINDGFNMLNLGIDAPDAENRNPALIAALERLKSQHLPIMVELLHGTVMGELKDPNKLSWNMELSNGERVKYFPDYANPEFREEFLKRLGNVVEFLKPYYGDPVVAFSIGHTDSFHIPDGEVHYAFKVKEVEGDATSLPYGKYALEGYRQYVRTLNLTPRDLGAQSEAALNLPTSSKTANNNLHWVTWIQYRRFYVKEFVSQGAEMVKVKSHLPVTAHCDINFSQIERYACPLYDFSDSLDFIGLYYYGLGDQSEFRVPELMAYVYRHFAARGKPMISYLELSSALGKIPTPSKDYIEASLPYVAGFTTTDFLFGGLDQKMLQWRYNGFVQAIREIREQKKVDLSPPNARIAVLLSTEDPQASENLGIPTTLADLQVPFDVIYDKDLLLHKTSLQRYQIIYTPPNQELMLKGKNIQQILSNFEKSQGHWVKPGQETLLWADIDMQTGLMKATNKKVIDTAIQLLKDLDNADPKSFPGSYSYVDVPKDFKGWENSLGSNAKVDPPRTITVNKVNKNMQGIKYQKSISVPCRMGFTLTAYSGDPRVTLLSINGEGLSLGQDKREWIGIYLNDNWIPFLYGHLDTPYQYRIAIQPLQNKTVVAISMIDSQGNKLEQNWFCMKNSGNNYWMQLFWAYDNAEGTIKNIYLKEEHSL